MKKGLIIFGALLFLTACSSSKELDSFVESYNDAAYDYTSVDILKEKDFGEIEEEKYATIQTLYQLEGEQTLHAKYTDGKVTGYNMSISGDSPYTDKTGTGYESSLVLIKSLGLDQSLYENNYDKALGNDDIVTYQDGDYDVTLADFVVGDSHEGMTINIDRK
ncbi:membrane lipoprotein lipid attachment site-containing protein [Sporosarcina sp. Sa2YVA2]|uniref:Membrane lipoprotein lipid attachment site-containing protein n=1 Tax=Sporosarcina quadrami TaxID=2762234 RepID=A0ABR8U8R1_9BACL|nr:membrane lipoprotein lipid attachment site-containing protein [Sporosarcina quadrami]MBD7984421.1 membrane lipoprotein lipid attachment site-containing protein [Sporosarcina quadrami]